MPIHHLALERTDGEQRAGGDTAAVQHAAVDLVQLADKVGQLLSIGEGDGAAGRQGRGLAGAVAEHGIRLHTQGAEQAEQGLAGDEHRLGAHVHVEQARLQALAQLVIQLAGRREQDVGTGRAGLLVVQALPEVEPLAHFRELLGQVGQHVQVLRALSGEQEGQLAL